MHMIWTTTIIYLSLSLSMLLHSWKLNIVCNFFSVIEDPDRSDSFVADTPITYEIIEGGSKRRFKKLVCSDGYAYVAKVITEAMLFD